MKFKNIFYILMIGVFAFSHADISESERYKTLVDQAKADQKAGHHKDAVKTFKRVYSKTTEFKSDVLEGMTDSYIAIQNYDAAEDILKEEISKNPFVGEYRLLLSKVYSASDKFVSALEEIESAEKIMGTSKTVLRMKADAQKKLNRDSDAIVTLTAYLKLDPKDHVALIDRAECNFNLKKYDQAFNDAQLAYDARSFDEKVNVFFTKASYFNTNYAEVKKIGKKCIELFPKNEQCHQFLGQAFYQTKDHPNAIKHFEAALQLNENNPEIRLMYAESLALNNNEAASDSQFALTLKQRPDFEAAMRSWAQFLNQRKKVEALGVALRKFCDQNPGNVWAATELAKLLFLVGDQEAGLDRMDTVTSENKSDIARFFHAYFLDAAGKHKKARNNLEDIKDKNIDINFPMGIAYVKDKKYKDAVKFWSKIKGDSPNYFKAQVNIALAYEQQGEIAKAKEMLSALYLAVPSEFKTALEQKIASLDGDRKPAADNNKGINFFLEWSLPQI